jgi:hypothetical protein
MSLLTLVHVTSGTLVLLVGGAVLSRSVWPRPSWVATCCLGCIVALGASAAALSLQVSPLAPAQALADSMSEPVRDAARESVEVSRPALRRVCPMVL